MSHAEKINKLIEELLDEGYDNGLIASELGISKATVQKIKINRYLPELSGDFPEQDAEAGQELIDDGEDILTIKDQEKNTNKWAVKESDLCGPELDRNQVCKLILEWVEENGVKDQDAEIIGNALDEAQVDASRRHRNGRIPLPIKLRQTSELLLNRFAIIRLGGRGRSNSSKYKVIKEQA